MAVAATASSLSDPLIGRIYELRPSIKQAFNNDQPNSIKSFLSSGESSLSASSTTNTTPTQVKKYGSVPAGRHWKSPEHGSSIPTGKFSDFFR
jgi:hypothetical protein